MNKISFPLIVVVLFALDIHAQVVENWVNVFSNDNLAMAEIAYDNAVDSEHNVYVCGQTGVLNGYDYDAVALKISPEGETLWYHIFGDDTGDNNWGDSFDKLLLDEEDEAVYFVGQYCPPSNPTNTQIYLVKINLEGEVLYTKTYVGGYGNGIVKGNDGYLYLSGAERAGSETKLFLAKIDPQDGSAQWQVDPMPGGMYGGGMELCLDDAGNIYQAGILADDWAVIKYSPDGAVLWYDRYNSQNFPGGWFPVARFISFANGNVYASGTVKEMNGNDMYTACYNPADGSLVWSDIYDGGYDFDNVEDMAVDGVGNIIVVGNSFTSETASDEVVIKYSPDGNILWSYINNVEGKEEGLRGVVVDIHNDIYAAGYRQTGNVQYPDDYLTQKFSGEDGSLIWEFTFDRDSTTDEANTICLFDVDDVTVSGRSHTWNSWYDIVTVNYRDTLQTFVADLATADYKLINYPNPFSNSTVIKYSLSGQTSSCVVEIYNMQGRKVKTFHRNDLSSGQYSFEWNKIEEMTPGIYLCRLKVNGKYVADRKMLAVP